jgi:Large polyvalent protein-associated domain 5/Large polyvalent protein associated domain 38/Large polyvalent protein-associated domain 1
MAKKDFSDFAPVAKESFDDFAPVAKESFDDFAPVTPAKPKRSAFDYVRDAGAGLLKIGGTAVKSGADLAQLATGGAVGADTSATMKRGMTAIDEVIGSDALNAEKAAFAQVMNSPDSGVRDALKALYQNPMLAADMGVSTIGSMMLPMGAVGAASKIASIGAKAATGIAVGTGAAQNAAETYTQTQGNQGDKYKAAAISGAISAVLGKLAGGGVEGQIARQMTKSGAGVIGARGVLKATAKESGEEFGQEAGNVFAQNVGEGAPIDVNAMLKQGAVGAALGAAVGGGVSTYQAARPSTAPQPTIPQLGYDPTVQNVQTLIADAQGNIRPEDSAEAFYRAQAIQEAADIGLSDDVRRAQAMREASSEDFSDFAPANQAEPELLQMLRRAGWTPQQQVFNEKPDLAPEQVQQLKAALSQDVEAEYQQDVKEGIKQRLGMTRRPEAAAPESYAQNPLLRLIANNGGINLDERSDFNVDPKRQTKIGKTMPNPYNIAGNPLFRKGGRDGDMLVELLEQNGYLTQSQIDYADANTPGGSYQMAYDMVSQAIQDPESIGLDAQDAITRRAQAAQDRQLQEDAGRYGIDTRGMEDRQIENQISRVMRRAEQPATPDFQSRKMARIEDAETMRGRAMAAKLDRMQRFAEFRDLDDVEAAALAQVLYDDNGQPVVTTRTEIDRNTAHAEYLSTLGQDYAAETTAERPLAEQNQASAPRESAQGIGSAGQNPARAQPRSDAGSRETGQDSDQTLTSYTEAEVRQREERAASEARRQEREKIESERRAEADAQRDDFTLTGSDRAADQGAARGKTDIFSQPEPAKPRAEEAKPATPAAKIQDFGKKIGGAKKDTWSGFKDQIEAVKDEDIAQSKLSEIWPSPDYQKLIDEGMNAGSVAVLRSLRDQIPAKPRASYKLRNWVELVKEMRNLATELLESKQSAKSIVALLGKDNRVARGIGGRAELYEALGHEKSLDGIRFGYQFFNLYRGRENVGLWIVERDAAATAFSNWPQELATGDTKEEALANFKKKYDELDAVAAVKKASYDIFTKSSSKSYFVGKKIGRNVAELAGPFNSLKEARDYRQNNLAELDKKLEKYKEIPRERRDTNNPRVGEDMRNGQDVTPEMFGETFGFRGVEFGNWVEQKRRQKDLNDAFDSLMDMAAVLEIPAKAISLNGELALAFGARGSGGMNPAAAHYEPGKIVINLTKREGAGSLGHEWWHALDNYFSRMRGKASDMTTEALDVSLASRGSAFELRGNVRREMIEAFGGVVKAIKSTKMKERSAKLDAKRSKEYWTTGDELSARAFESYLIAKLQDQNASNDYLANVVDQKVWDTMASLGIENQDSYPYPIEAEMPSIRAGFDKFFQVIETKETDKGVALFTLDVKAEKPTHYVEASRIEPINPVTDPKKYEYLVKRFTQSGKFNGNPILAWRPNKGRNDWNAITGSHRVMAAQEAEIKVPVIEVPDAAFDFEDSLGRKLDELIGYGDDEVADFLREAADAKVIPERLAKIMEQEASRNRGDFILQTQDRSKTLANYRALSGEPSRQTATSDAEQILGFESPVPVLSQSNQKRADMRVPMWYDLNKKVIYYNTAYVGRDRASDAQWMTEEIMHAVDHIDGESMMSVSSDALRQGGELRMELEAANKRSKILNSVLKYPLDMQSRFTEDRIIAELFARTAVVYNGMPELLRAVAPKTYEVFHGFFQRRNEAVRSEARPNTTDRDQESGGLGTNRASSRSLYSADPASQKLEQFRDAIAESIGGKRDGRAGEFGGVSLEARAPWDVPDPTRLDKIRRDWQDNRIDIKKTVDSIKKYGASIGDDANPYLRDELYIGRVRDQLDKFADGQVTPLLRAISNSGISLETINRYLWARHAKERNQQMAKVNQETFTDDLNYAGMSTREARAELAKLASTKDYAKLQKLAAMVDDINRNTRTKIVTDGLEDAAVIKAWEGAYKFYVPLQRDIEESGKRGSGFNVKGSEARRAVGSKKEATNILANVIAQAESAIVRSEKATVGRSVLELAKQNPNPDFWTVDTPPTERVIDPRTGVVTKRVIPNYKNMDNVFVVKEAGVERFVTFNERNERAMEFARALKNLDAADVGAITETVGKGTRYLAQWVTARNPFFWVTNFVRDVQGVAFNLQSTPLKGQSARVTARIPQALAGVTANKLGKGGKYAKLAEEFKVAGGQTGFMQGYENSLERMTEIQKEVDRIGRKAYDPRKWGLALLDVIDGANDVIENGVRLAVFAQAREQGLSADQAASIAKNISVNFNRKGNKTAVMNSWYMFANASIQGNARLIEGIATSKRSQVAAGLLVAAGAAMAYLNWAVSGEDEESRKRRYELIPQHERERNWIVFFPNSDKYLKIPLPLGPHILFNAGRIGTELGAENNPDPLEKAASFVSSVFGAFNPIGGGLPSADIKGLAQIATPTVFRPLTDVAVNQNFAGTPISRQEFPGQKGDPDYTKAKDSTAPYWTAASKAMNDATGGDNIKPGFVNIKPETLAYILKSYITPSIAQTADKVASQAMSKKEVDWMDRPGVSKFAGRVDEGNRERAAYETREKDAERSQQYEAYLNAGERAKAQALMKEWGDGSAEKGRKLYAQYENLVKHEQAIARERRAIKKLPEAQQEARMTRLEERRARIQAVYLRNRRDITGEEE